MKKLAKEIWIVGAKRTPFGDFSGALKGVSAIDLGVVASKAAIAQSGVPVEEFDHTIFGNVLQSSTDAIYGARHVGLKSGLGIDVPGLTVNRLCGSGFQVVVNAAQQILLGDSKAVLAVGGENMSQAPHCIYGLRDGGQKFGRPAPMVDSLWEALTDSFCNTPMAMTAENIAEKYKVTREDADTFALGSQKKWAAAQESGGFADEMAPVTVTSRRKEIVVDKDEHPRPETTMEILAGLPAVFKKGGVVSAGNASGICDGAGAMVVVDGEWGKAQGLKPLAKLVQWGVAGVEPTLMGLGPVPAIRQGLERAGLTIDDVDLFDVNEAFSSQFLGVQRELGLPDEKTNVNGGAVALGHPLGASGARITSNLIYTARKRGKKFAVGSACIGGGQGIALVLEMI